MKGHTNQCRKCRGNEWAKQIEHQHNNNSKAKVISYYVTNINIYLTNPNVELIPTHGKFEVYNPNQNKGRKKR